MEEFDELEDVDELDEDPGSEMLVSIPCDFCTNDATHACFNCGKNGCEEHVLEIFIWKENKSHREKKKVKCCIDCLSIVDLIDEEEEDDWDVDLEDDEEDEDDEEFDDEYEEDDDYYFDDDEDEDDEFDDDDEDDWNLMVDDDDDDYDDDY